MIRIIFLAVSLLIAIATSSVAAPNAPATGQAVSSQSRRAEVKEHWVQRRNGVVVENTQKTTSVMIPAGGATLRELRGETGELARIAKENNTAISGRLGTIEGKLPSLEAAVVAAKDEMVAVADQLEKEFPSVIDNSVKNAVSSEMGEINKAAEDIKKVPAEVGQAVAKEAAGLKRLALITLGVLGLGFIILALIGLNSRPKRKGKSADDLNSTGPAVDELRDISRKLETLEELVRDIPDKSAAATAMTLKELEGPFEMVDVGEAKKVATIDPKIVNGRRASLKVDKGRLDPAGYSDLDEVPRVFIKKKSDFLRATDEVLADYVDGKLQKRNDFYSLIQLRVIERAIATGELIIK